MSKVFRVIFSMLFLGVFQLSQAATPEFSPSSLQGQPDEMLSNIMSGLDPEDATQMMLTCKRFEKIGASHPLWGPACINLVAEQYHDPKAFEWTQADAEQIAAEMKKYGYTWKALYPYLVEIGKITDKEPMHPHLLLALQAVAEISPQLETAFRVVAAATGSAYVVNRIWGSGAEPLLLLGFGFSEFGSRFFGAVADQREAAVGDVDTMTGRVMRDGDTRMRREIEEISERFYEKYGTAPTLLVLAEGDRYDWEQN